MKLIKRICELRISIQNSPKIWTDAYSYSCVLRLNPFGIHGFNRLVKGRKLYKKVALP